MDKRTARFVLLSKRQQSLQLFYHRPNSRLKMYEGCLIAAAQRLGGACCHPVQLCLLGLFFFLLSLVISCLDLEKTTLLLIRLWQRDCEGCHLTLLLKKRIEGVQTHSFLLSECVDSPSAGGSSTCPLLLLHSHFSITYLYFQPLSPHQSFPIHRLPSSSPVSSVCAGNDLCCCKKICLISIFVIKFRFTKLVWLKHIASTILPLSSLHIGNGWLFWG